MPDGSSTFFNEDSLKLLDEDSLKTHLSKKAVPFDFTQTKNDLIATHPNFSLKPIYFDIQFLDHAPLGLIPLATKYGHTYLNLNFGNEDLILKFKNSLQGDGYTVTVEVSHLPGDDKKNEHLLICLVDRYGGGDNDFCFLLRVKDQRKAENVL